MLYSALALLSVLAAAYSQQVIEVPMTSSGRQYNIRFLASSPLAAVTREFCITNADSLGITPLTEESLPGCQGPVAAHIQQHVQAALAQEPAAQEVVAIQLDIGANQYDLRFHPTADSILAVSRDFCIRNAAALGITPLTEESLPGCQGPVVEYMRAAALKSLEPAAAAPPAAPPAAPAAIQTVLTIAGQQVSFEVQPTEASVLQVSRDFCIRNQAALGIQPLTEESLPGCQQPVLDALVGAVRADAATKQQQQQAQQQQQQAQQQQVAEVKVTVGANQYLVRFRPAAEPVQQVARDFCISHAASLGITPLTEESLPDCQAPVAQYLAAQLASL